MTQFVNCFFLQRLINSSVKIKSIFVYNESGSSNLTRNYGVKTLECASSMMITTHTFHVLRIFRRPYKKYIACHSHRKTSALLLPSTTKNQSSIIKRHGHEELINVNARVLPRRSNSHDRLIWNTLLILIILEIDIPEINKSSSLFGTNVFVYRVSIRY